MGVSIFIGGGRAHSQLYNIQCRTNMVIYSISVSLITKHTHTHTLTHAMFSSLSRGSALMVLGRSSK